MCVGRFRVGVYRVTVIGRRVREFEWLSWKCRGLMNRQKNIRIWTDDGVTETRRMEVRYARILLYFRRTGTMCRARAQHSAPPPGRSPRHVIIVHHLSVVCDQCLEGEHYVTPDQPQAWMLKRRLVLTGGAYNGCADDVLDEAKLMAEPMLIEIDTVDSLFLLPDSIWLVA